MPLRFFPVLAAALLPLTTVSAEALRVAIAVEDDAFASAITAALTASPQATVTRLQLPESNALAAADVLVLQRGSFAPLPESAQQALTAFAQRGGGLVALHGAIASAPPAVAGVLFGGAWTPQSQRFGSRMMLYIRPDGTPLAENTSSFDLDDETLYDLSLADGITVLGSAFTPKVANARNAERAAQEAARTGRQRASIYDIQPQFWSWDGPHHRAAVFLQGSAATLQHATVRTLVLRATAWTGRLPHTDTFLPADAATTLRYPAGGPLPPAAATAALDLPDEFTASTVAAEPLIAKPVAIQWDARGRLWIAETPEYPNGRRPYTGEPWKDTGSLVPGAYDRAARDSISILTDQDGDGHFDHKQLWHTGIELVCGFCFHQDGIIAINYPDISWIRDTDGDGKSDTVVPLFSNVPFPNHFILNHLIAAPDGWIYASSGTRFQPTRPGETEPFTSLSNGIIRFRPDGSAIEQVGSIGGNSFGLDLTSEGELFLGMATSGNPLQHLVLPEWTLAKAKGLQVPAFQSVNPGRAVVRPDLPDRAPLMQIGGVGRYSAACSATVYEGGAWPASWHHTIWCTEPILDIVHHEKLQADGPSFRGEVVFPEREFIRARDYWFCPVDVATAPDGSLFVLDFYTPVVAHNDTRGPAHGKAGASIRPDREHYFGRIIRVQHRKARQLTVPDLTALPTPDLPAAFSHPSKTVRFLAQQQFVERPDARPAIPALTAALGAELPAARSLVLWSLHRLKALAEEEFSRALKDPDAAVRTTALLVAEAEKRVLSAEQAARALADDHPRVRIAALRALTVTGVNDATGSALAAAQAGFTDPWSRAAAAAAASSHPTLQLSAAFSAPTPPDESLIASLATVISREGRTDAALTLLRCAPRHPAAATVALRILAQEPPPPPAGDDARKALEYLSALLASDHPGLAGAALPIATAWDAAPSLADARRAVAERLAATTIDANAQPTERTEAVRMLLATRRTDPALIPKFVDMLATAQPESFRRSLVAALAETGDSAAAAALAQRFPSLGATVRDAVFQALLPRPEWTDLLLDALEARTLNPALLSPTQRGRLIAHPQGRTAERARRILEALGSGTNPAKDQLIADLLPVVQQPGNPAQGKALFATCASCHQFQGAGHLFGPALDGMGAHPVADLLVHLIDPDRSVDDEHRTWNITMKDGAQHSALIAGENEASLRIRLPAGVTLDLPKADIADRRSSPASLMPQGLEALGGEALRDIIAYLQSAPQPRAATQGDGAFHPIDLTMACTADNRLGLFNTQANRDNTIPFLQLGRVMANGIPFDLANPATSPGGRTLVVLRADRPGTHAATYPVRVEIPVGFPVQRMHFLGGIAGWGGQKGADLPAMKVTFVHADGTQSFTLRAGHEFADYIRRIDVPGSEFAAGIVRDKQIRTFSLPVERASALERIILESPLSRCAATTAALTAELRPGAGAPAIRPAPPTVPNPPTTPNPPAPSPVPGSPAPSAAHGNPAPPPDSPENPRTTLATGQKFAEPKPAGTIRVLLTGAGGAHDFPRFFLRRDAETLRSLGGIDTAATPNADEARALLPLADVVVFSANHPSFSRTDFMKALHGFADSGKGLVILHAGTWRNYAPHTGFNQRFVGGGAKGHGSGDITVSITNPNHPVTRDVPRSFLIRDESYHAILDAGAITEILAENSPDNKTSKVYPSVWTVSDPKSRIVNISLGHADPAHSHPAYQKLLGNAVRWAAPPP
jgi:putative membrane-bound dehydrogenase-like protein